jgi:hypothetical protein
MPLLFPRFREYFLSRALFQCSCTPRLRQGIPSRSGSYDVFEGMVGQRRLMEATALSGCSKTVLMTCYTSLECPIDILRPKLARANKHVA